MKVYVAVRFKGLENRDEVEELCRYVKEAGLEDFCFVRDVENYKKTFDDPKELWIRALDEIRKCDVLLIDISDNPTGGRVAEVGIAYALGKPVYALVKRGIEYKEMFKGLSLEVIEYSEKLELPTLIQKAVGYRQTV